MIYLIFLDLETKSVIFSEYVYIDVYEREESRKKGKRQQGVSMLQCES